jgi:hypothetical protein
MKTVALLLITACTAFAQAEFDVMLGIKMPAAASAASTNYDVFDRTETPLSKSGEWTMTMNSVNANGTVAIGVTASSENFARFNTPAFAANQLARIVLTSILDSGVVVRMDANANGYVADRSGTGSITLYKVTNNGGTFTTMGAVFETTINTGDILTLKATGTSTTTLEIFLNGSSLGTRTDSSTPHTSGQPGIHLYDEGTVDAIYAGDV